MKMEEEKMDTNVDDSFDPSVFPDLLSMYYKRFFPFSLYHQWLKYESDKYFVNREFSFTLKDDVYIRYQSFKDEEDLKKEVCQKCPYKIDIGAVYSCRPSDQRTASNFMPLEKELVFDIDMTDYDEVRTCCNGADICRKCWPFMTIAMKILDRALREDFGFHHLLWVYSGRRGIHCWVCDKVARELSSSARAAIVEYLSVVKGGEYKSKKVHLPEVLHPSLRQAEKIINKHFDDLMLRNQDYLSSNENCDKIINMCADQEGKKLLKNGFSECSTSIQKWSVLERVDDVALHQKGSKNRSKHFVTEVKFQLCYPRLDVNVTKGLNHLLKAPFCVHPKTGRVCVPIDISCVDKFDPFTVPTVESLMKEIDEYDASVKATQKPSDDLDTNAVKVENYTKTSLRTSVEVFQKFLKHLQFESK